MPSKPCILNYDSSTHRGTFTTYDLLQSGYSYLLNTKNLPGRNLESEFYAPRHHRSQREPARLATLLHCYMLIDTNG